MWSTNFTFDCVQRKRVVMALKIACWLSLKRAQLTRKPFDWLILIENLMHTRFKVSENPHILKESRKIYIIFFCFICCTQLTCLTWSEIRSYWVLWSNVVGKIQVFLIMVRKRRSKQGFLFLLISICWHAFL